MILSIDLQISIINIILMSLKMPQSRVVIGIGIDHTRKRKQRWNVSSKYINNVIDRNAWKTKSIIVYKYIIYQVNQSIAPSKRNFVIHCLILLILLFILHYRNKRLS